MATRVSRADGFGRSSRFYEIEDHQLPSVTTILGVVARPALINWAAKEERSAVVDAACKLWEDVPTAPKMAVGAYRSTLEGRLTKEKAHRKLTAKAADIGSQAHALIEWTLRGELLQERDAEPAATDKARWAFMAWEDWRKASALAPLHIEQTVWSDKHGYAGTTDIIGEVTHPDAGRIHVVGDWKSSKGIWPEMFLQAAAYTRAVEEMGHQSPSGEFWGMIVRLPKNETDPAFEVKWIPPHEIKAHFKAFLAALELWKWQEQQGAH